MCELAGLRWSQLSTVGGGSAPCRALWHPSSSQDQHTGRVSSADENGRCANLCGETCMGLLLQSQNRHNMAASYSTRPKILSQGQLQEMGKRPLTPLMRGAAVIRAVAWVGKNEELRTIYNEPPSYSMLALLPRIMPGSLSTSGSIRIYSNVYKSVWEDKISSWLGTQ